MENGIAELTRDESAGRICVFCGSKYGFRPVYADLARAVGRLIAERGFDLVYGGSREGLMGVLADEVLAARGKVIGVYPRLLQTSEPAHTGLTELVLVDSLQERKSKMNELANAFIALPGGMGTLDELSEVVAWSMLGVHRKPMGVVDSTGYFRPLFAQFDRMVDEGFLSQAHRALLRLDDKPDLLLDWLFETHQASKTRGSLKSETNQAAIGPNKPPRQLRVPTVSAQPIDSP